MMSNYFNEWWSELIKQSAIERITPEYLAWEEIKCLRARINEYANTTITAQKKVLEDQDTELQAQDRRIKELEKLLESLYVAGHFQYDISYGARAWLWERARRAIGGTEVK